MKPRWWTSCPNWKFNVNVKDHENKTISHLVCYLCIVRGIRAMPCAATGEESGGSDIRFRKGNQI